MPFNQAFSPEGDLLSCPAKSALYGHKGRVVVSVGNRNSKNAANVSYMILIKSVNNGFIVY